MLQSSLENLIVALKYPVILNFKITNVYPNKKHKFLRKGSESSIIWWLTGLKVVLSVTLLISSIFYSVLFYIPVIYILIDQLGTLRTKLLGNSESPIQRAVLVSLVIHYGIQNTFLSELSLIFMIAMVSLSYFAAGWHKMKEPDWRDGTSMKFFLTSYLGLRVKFLNPLFFKYIGILTLLFQCTFVISTFHLNLACIYIGIGFLFHLFLVIIKGVNFFFWTYLSVYMAIFYFVI